MGAREFEIFLTRIYVDVAAREAFKANRRGEALRAGLSEEECTALENTDLVDLELAARSYAHKRRSKLKRAQAHSIALGWRTFCAALRKMFHSLY
jgi:hypothetical protein